MVNDLALEIWLESGEARLLVGRDGEILWANSRAFAVLEACTSMRAIAGRLELVSRTASPDLAFLLTQADEGAEGHIVCGSDGQPDLLAVIEKLNAAEGVCGLRLRLLQGQFPALPDLRQAYGLTAAESAIVMSIMRGETADSIANNGRVSLETVRTHIRHIYVKLQVSSRAGLFAKLSPTLFWRE